MIIFKKAGELSQYLGRQKDKGKKIGFVPTMGALHEGHLSLIDAARKENDLTVCSIFINPTQFNNPDDFRHYPVNLENDIRQLIGCGTDALFLPPTSEIYPKGFQPKHFELGALEQVLEGHFRPGHFQGVCQVVERLLDIIQPHRLYLGQKDFQQCMVIARLLKLTGKADNIQISIIPTRREPDGLAMSSRNLRLNEKERKNAVHIYKQLSHIKENIHSETLPALKQKAIEELQKQGFIVDYVEIANQDDLTPATSNSVPLVALAAASLGKVRLIDNLLLN